MAYADTTNTPRKTATAIAVLALEVGLAVALVKGLTMDGHATLQERVTTFFIPKEQPKPLPPPQPRADHKQQDLKPIKAPETPFDTLKGDGVLTLPTGPIDPPGGGIAEVKFPEIAPPQPKPGFAPRLARPKGSPGAWVSNIDYPTRDLREGNAGVVRFRLEVSADGRVTDCRITQTSGHAGLDEATCDKLTRRARFDPASDETGANVSGSYSGAVRWQIPE